MDNKEAKKDRRRNENAHAKNGAHALSGHLREWEESFQIVIL